MKERLKALGWSIVFLVGGYALTILLLILLGRVTPPPDAGSLGEAAITSGALLLGYGIATWLIGMKALKLTAADFLGARAPGVGARLLGLHGLGWGVLVGGVLAGLAMLIAVPLGHAAWRTDGGTVPQWLATLSVTAVVMLPAALAEELAFRSVPLLALSRAFGRIPALVGLATLFAYAHTENPGVSTLALMNIGLAGIFLGLAFFSPGGLWTSTGAHLGWNLAIAALAAPVSGIPLPMPWLDYAPGRPSWLTGGSFGPEGGALASLCLLSGAFLAARRARREGTA
ncbi:MAG TPA: CPBP family intramembrane glutamic endopeptidase [Gemmatimonadales bacterium]|nr:CPBP family intramembrane glutamic endopeptidase [Gemmatimonadales bacterium]